MNKNKITLALQLILLIIGIVLLITSIFKNFLLPYSEIAIGLTLLVMAYNNDKIFKRKGFTILYIIFGLLVILNGIWSIFNG